MAEHIRTVVIPSVPHGPKGVALAQADADYYREAALRIRSQFPKSRFAGSNLTETVARLCEAAAVALDASDRCRCGHARSEHRYLFPDGPCGAFADGCDAYAQVTPEEPSHD